MDKLKYWAQLLQCWRELIRRQWLRFQESGSYDDYLMYVDLRLSGKAIIQDARKEGIYLV